MLIARGGHQVPRGGGRAVNTSLKKVSTHAHSLSSHEEATRFLREEVEQFFTSLKKVGTHAHSLSSHEEATRFLREEVERLFTSLKKASTYLLVLEVMTPAPPVEALCRRLCRLVVGPSHVVACRSASVAVHSSCVNSGHNSIFKYRDRSAGLDLIT